MAEHACPKDSWLLAPDHPVRWIVVGRLLDSIRRRVVSRAHLVYDHSRILHAGAEEPPPHLRGGGLTAPDREYPELTALPAFIEAHSHVGLEGSELNAEKRTQYQNQPPAELLSRAERRVRALARLGVAAMRDGGDKDGVGQALSRRTRGTTPELAGTARVYSPGPGIHRKGRYGSFFSRPVEDYADLEACVLARAADGADHIKIVPTGIINFAKGAVVAPPQFAAEEIARFKRAALGLGKQLMAHASGEVGIGNAIAGGVDTVEHAYFVTDEQLARMRDGGLAWVPTFAPVQEQVDHAATMGWAGETLDNLQRILDGHARSLLKALALGVNVLVGSDAGSCGVGHGVGLIREMELLERAGMPTLDVLCQATEGNRRTLALDDSIGAIAAGRRPRFILTKEDPLASVVALYRPYIVVFDGTFHDSATVAPEDL
jgi:imidazolonepropionase-like amidohydrolase